MERRETSTAIHPDQVLAKCANGQMETRLAVLCLSPTTGRRPRPRRSLWRALDSQRSHPLAALAAYHDENEDQDEHESARLLAPGFWLLAPILSRLAELRQRHYRIRMQRANPVEDLGSQTRGRPVGGKDYF
jgi:hypothetical protein